MCRFESGRPLQGKWKQNLHKIMEAVADTPLRSNRINRRPVAGIATRHAIWQGILRFFNRLKQFRCVATRYDKLSSCLTLSCISYVSMPSCFKHALVGARKISYIRGEFLE